MNLFKLKITSIKEDLYNTKETSFENLVECRLDQVLKLYVNNINRIYCKISDSDPQELTKEFIRHEKI